MGEVPLYGFGLKAWGLGLRAGGRKFRGGRAGERVYGSWGEGEFSGEGV